MPLRKPARRLQPVGLHLGHRRSPPAAPSRPDAASAPACVPRPACASSSGSAARIFSASASITAGIFVTASSPMVNLAVSALCPIPGPMASTVFPAVSPARISGARFSAAICPAARRRQRPGHQLRRNRRHQRQRRRGNRRRHQPRPRPQSRQRRHGRRARFAPRRSQTPTHHQHVPKVALVGRRRPRGLDQRMRRARPIQSQLRNDRLIRRPDRRHHNRLVPPPRQLPKNVRQFRRGKRHHGIGRKRRVPRRQVFVRDVQHGPIKCGRRLVRRPARGQIHRQHRRRARLHPLQRRQRQPLQRRLKARSQHRVHNQIGIEQRPCAAPVPPLHEPRARAPAPTRSTRATPRRHRPASPRARPAAASSPPGRLRPGAAPPSCRRRRYCRARTAPSPAAPAETAPARTPPPPPTPPASDPATPPRTAPSSTRSQACISAAERTCMASMVVHEGTARRPPVLQNSILA